MRSHRQIYSQAQTLRIYSVAEICQLCEAGTVAYKSLPERKRMRWILKNNIEAQRGFAQRADLPAKRAHLATALKLEKYRKKINSQI
jgi:hypothetical protein